MVKLGYPIVYLPVYPSFFSEVQLTDSLLFFNCELFAVSMTHAQAVKLLVVAYILDTIVYLVTGSHCFQSLHATVKLQM